MEALDGPHRLVIMGHGTLHCGPEAGRYAVHFVPTLVRRTIYAHDADRQRASVQQTEGLIGPRWALELGEVGVKLVFCLP